MGVIATALGQVGYIFESKNSRIIIDPYLSDYVAELFGDQLKRPYAHTILEYDLSRLDALLLTHAHEDHCDPVTIKRILSLNSSLKIYGTYECLEVLVKHGITIENFLIADSINRFSVGDFKITSVLAAHTQIEINENGNSRYLGYLIQVEDLVLYHAGDTIPDERIDTMLPNSFDYAFLPINERNYFRDRLGIIGNMSCREALQWGAELNVKNFIPTHWDTFQMNSTNKEELEFLYNSKNFEFKLQWIDAGQTIKL